MHNNISLTLQPTDIEMDKVTLEHQPYIIQYPFPNIRSHDCQMELTHSIKRYGLLAPIIVQKTKKGNIFIVHGANRFLACHSIGWSTISSRVIPPSMQDQKTYLLSLSLFLSHKKPNSMEQAKIMRKLLSFFPEKKIIRDYLPLLGLPQNEKAFSKIFRLADLEEAIAQDLVEKKINPELALRLLKLSSPERLQTHRFLRQLPFTTSQQFEVLENLQEISLRDHIPVQKILSDQLILHILAQDQDQRQKALAVRIYLRKKRYPRLTTLEHEFAQEKKNLRLPEHLELYPPAHFEHGNYKFELKFADFSEFEQKLSFLNKLAKNNMFQTIIKS